MDDADALGRRLWLLPVEGCQPVEHIGDTLRAASVPGVGEAMFIGAVVAGFLGFFAVPLAWFAGPSLSAGQADLVWGAWLVLPVLAAIFGAVIGALLVRGKGNAVLCERGIRVADRAWPYDAITRVEVQNVESTSRLGVEVREPALILVLGDPDWPETPRVALFTRSWAVAEKHAERFGYYAGQAAARAPVTPPRQTE